MSRAYSVHRGQYYCFLCHFMHQVKFKLSSELNTIILLLIFIHYTCVHCNDNPVPRSPHWLSHKLIGPVKFESITAQVLELLEKSAYMTWL